MTKRKDEPGLVLPPMRGALIDFSALGCPECEWQPKTSDHWRCACGHAWNVFETQGVCPLCGAQHPEPACLSCEETSPLAAWRGEAVDSPVEEEDEEEEEDDEDEDEDDRSAAFMAPVTPSPELARIVGEGPLTRVEVTKRVWEHVKKHQLQDAVDKRMINADPLLRAVLGADQVSMFELTAKINAHLS